MSEAQKQPAAKSARSARSAAAGLIQQGSAAPVPGAPVPGAPVSGVQRRITELRVSGHLMTLDPGTFCVFHAPGSPVADAAADGLPAVRLSLPPGDRPDPEALQIRTFGDDGWLSGAGAAALIRVADRPTQILVTIYQAPGQGPETAPRLQVLRLSEEGQANGAAMAMPPAARPAEVEVLAHIQSTGDVGTRLGEWMGVPGSGSWIEGFAVMPPALVGNDGIEYQAVLGRGWTSPWVEGGEFCGSRGMALPLLGIRLRLKGAAASRYDLAYSASFVDGSRSGPVAGGEACESDSLAPLESFQIELVAKGPSARSPAWLNAEQLAPAAKPAPKRGR